jgi:short subunit dehydrogenase-like uncharacterized protein
VIGFAGTEIAAQVRLRGGRRLASPALIAARNHARIDGLVSLDAPACDLPMRIARCEIRIHTRGRVSSALGRSTDME